MDGGKERVKGVHLEGLREMVIDACLPRAPRNQFLRVAGGERTNFGGRIGDGIHSS